ncbi:HNH endonuclease [Clostridium botulinum]|nr:HNH endonuclease [Clostridium botulinum]NFL38453.1 HNH endonuclease [Clostridium botulinum]NFL65893.1 HNH endonuclease [Clostridium botulinum]NFN08290.1 HNH endonuclease [Clostridium botulinum]NFN18471.1 HNH endonuclease [Clostridium botulinum]
MEMAIMKLCPRCQGLMPYSNKLCNNCLSKITPTSIRAKIYKDSKNEKDKKLDAIYNSPRWKKLRKVVLVKANGLCEECLKRGKVSYVEDVHHKVPIRKDIRKAYDINNLVCLCRKCHREAHKKLKE